jgi:hypothetical protein
MLEDARSHYASDPDLGRVALNATSWVEANLALELMAESVPEKALVTLANIREALKELPQCPLAMALDFDRLAEIWELDREGMAWVRSFADDAGMFSILLLGDGNYCYDIIVRTEARTMMWMPRCRDDDFLNPDIIDLVMERPAVLGNVVELLKAMGLAFYPTFYLSLDDWRQEYAQAVFEEVVEGFTTKDVQDAGHSKTIEDKNPHGTGVRFRGVGDDGGLSWLL